MSTMKDNMGTRCYKPINNIRSISGKQNEAINAVIKHSRDLQVHSLAMTLTVNASLK